MMGWDLIDFDIDQRGGLASPFNFEILFSGAAPQGIPLRGGGVVLRTGSVRFEHEDELRRMVAQLGMNPDNFLEYLADVILARTYHPPARA
jgi:hypothetical protein